mmetsp:Transcript_32208/g.39934  ORF Transcript_32208/g.39934 Transcript_32208/m.39934 type:complete len:85 (+) Transcript_32208:127-381(+)|eukprot:CAMPEP_0170459168 /NCGR_PEP_ID=MMETSP0123-20130129/5957_1 /TAXON_ID=182087 /ORGANISM="Favella ehrenbergii, Strain Fehren 1" /LENGTH=84 /DNA_ID=CAMNT_0010723685 /DNA_START=119 /DNA_END=373 /DNA_ORIENTATION=-
MPCQESEEDLDVPADERAISLKDGPAGDRDNTPQMSSVEDIDGSLQLRVASSGGVQSDEVHAASRRVCTEVEESKQLIYAPAQN